MATSHDQPVMCPGCGLEFVVAGRVGDTHVQEPAPSVFRRAGEYWLIMFESDTLHLRDTRGLRYLAALVARPGQEMLALHLVTIAEGATPAPAAHGRVQGDDGLRLFVPGERDDVIDAKARAAYKRRLDELREAADDAERMGDAERLSRARDEIAALAHALSSALGLGGQTRSASSPAERARQSVTKAIRAAVDRIAEGSPALRAHFASTLRTGIYCIYDPDPRVPVAWRT